MTWYAIKTNPLCEKKAAGELRRAGIRVYLPKRSYPVRNRRSRKEEVRFRPLLVGYIFIRFPDELIERGVPKFRRVETCQGVRGYVCAANAAGEWGPFPIPDDAVSDFIRRQRRREFGRPAVSDPRQQMAELRKRFKPGLRARITDGPFAAFIATISEIKDRETVTAEVAIFGRPTRVNLCVSDIEPLAKSRAAA